jgi:hypothetical protein
VTIVKKKKEEEEEEEEETAEAFTANIRKHRVLEPVVERDTLQPTSGSTTDLSDSFPISETPNDDGGPTTDPSDSPKSEIPYELTLKENFFVLCIALVIVLGVPCVILLVCRCCCECYHDYCEENNNSRETWSPPTTHTNWSPTPSLRETERQINRQYEREMEWRNNRQLNANATSPVPGNNDSRDEFNTHTTYTYSSTVLRNIYFRNNSLPLSLSLSLDDRIELYNKTFNSNGNQLILKNKHIVSKINADKSIIEVCLDIELGDSKDSFSNIKNFIATVDMVEDAKETKMMTNGTCSICLDEFIENDLIVYSESCSHVYHKHCMVSYLATNAQREIYGTLDITDNPCPSCRQNYCQVRDDDLSIVLSGILSTSVTAVDDE